LQSAGDYQSRVDIFIGLLQGRSEVLESELQERMREAASTMEFERAAHYRDRLRVIQNFMTRQKVESAGGENRDVIGLAREDNQACGTVFKIRNGKMLGRYHTYLQGTLDREDPELMQVFMQKYYLEADHVPGEILLSHPVSDETLITEWLQGIRQGAVHLRIPERGDKRKLVRLVLANARLLLGEYMLQKMKRDQVAGSVVGLQRDLGLEKPPVRIEAFDISHFGGTDTVASLVVFEQGKPARSQYRHYDIKTVQGIDDFASMEEVVRRRYSRLQREKAAFPDLVLIDGGKGQLGRAVRVLADLGVVIPVIGLAKRFEEVYKPGISDPQQIPRSSYSIKLLQQVRDEAHRFAITHNRKKRSGRVTRSQLDSIPGVGPSGKKALLRKFRTLEAVKAASVEDLMETPGVGRTIAGRIYNHFRRQET